MNVAPMRGPTSIERYTMNAVKPPIVISPATTAKPPTSTSSTLSPFTRWVRSGKNHARIVAIARPASRTAPLRVANRRSAQPRPRNDLSGSSPP